MAAAPPLDEWSPFSTRREEDNDAEENDPQPLRLINFFTSKRS